MLGTTWRCWCITRCLCVRYNLAVLVYHPTLKFQDLWGSGDTAADHNPVSVEFDRGSTIGGRLGETFTAQRGGVYQVDRDVTVLPEGRLLVQPGATLHFQNGLGVLIQVSRRSLSMLLSCCDIVS